MPAFQALREAGSLPLDRPITLITGENGVGKSTLVEGIAVSTGFNSEGGPMKAFKGRKENPLRRLAKVTKGNRAIDGYFLRAEQHFEVATKLGNSGPRAANLHQMSHGESVMHVIQESFGGRGLYILDEPEAGLSVVRQMALMAELHRVAAHGGQIIAATHSPILLAMPGAEVWEFSADGSWERGMNVQDTTAFRAMRDFLADPPGIATFMIDATAP